MAKSIKNKVYKEFWNDDEINVDNDKKENNKISSDEIKKVEKKLTKKVSNLEKELKVLKGDEDIKPVGNPPRGWHMKLEFIDDDGNKFEKGVYVGKIEEPKIEEPKIEEPKNKIDKNSEKVVDETIKNVKPKTDKELYQQYINDGTPFRMYYRGVLIFDSVVQPSKNYPIFQDSEFILFGKNYIYRGIRIEKY